MKRRLIDSTSVFSPLKSDEKDKLVEHVQISTYVKDQFVIKENQLGDDFYIIEKGEAICTKASGNETVTLRKIKEGDHFGEGALYKQEKRTYNVMSITPLTVLSIKRESFVKLLGSYEKLVERNNMEDFVNSIHFFGSMKLTLAAQEKLIKNAKIQTYKTNDVIIKPGDAPSKQ